MAFFPRFAQEISPFFRLLDDYDRAVANSSRQIRAFTPKFDVKEVEKAYELHGELPGIDQKDINIEWSDSNTLTISGRVESRYESGEPPQAIQETENENEKHEYHKPTIEEEGKISESSAERAIEPEGTVAKTSQNQEVAKPSNTAKYWVTERSVGEFHRSFSFPGRVDHEGVKANLKNGILTIVVPKAQKPETRRINIQSDDA